MFNSTPVFGGFLSQLPKDHLQSPLLVINTLRDAIADYRGRNG